MLFLGLASNYSPKNTLKHALFLGTRKSLDKLNTVLAKRYNSTLEQTAVVYSGRTAIYLALASFIEAGKLQKGDKIVINGFTCHAVLEAIKKAKLEPVFADTEQKIPDYSPETLEKLVKSDKKIKAFILQNTFGNSVDIEKFTKIKEKYNLILIEDLAHCAGRKYKNRKEIGTVGDATCLSFGKGKAIDTIIGGAIILRGETKFPKYFEKENLKKPNISDSMRAGWYPLFGSLARGLAHIKLEKPFLALLLKLKWIEKSADTALDETRTITDWQAKLVLSQLENLKNSPLRDYFLVNNREECLKELKKNGFRLEELWYEVPVAPKRYYKKVNFPESSCKNATKIAEQIINLPTWYTDKKHKKEIKKAKQIIEKYQIKD